MLHEVFGYEEAMKRVEDDGTEADDESKIISVGGPLSNIAGYESEGVTFEEAVGGGRGGGWSCFTDSHSFEHDWSTAMLVFKLLYNLYFLIMISHWPVVPSVRLDSQMSRSWLRHQGCVSVYDPGREPVRQPEHGRVVDQSASGSELEVGGANYGEDFPRKATRRAPLAAKAES